MEALRILPWARGVACVGGRVFTRVVYENARPAAVTALTATLRAVEVATVHAVTEIAVLVARETDVLNAQGCSGGAARTWPAGTHTFDVALDVPSGVAPSFCLRRCAAERNAIKWSIRCALTRTDGPSFVCVHACVPLLILQAGPRGGWERHAPVDLRQLHDSSARCPADRNESPAKSRMLPRARQVLPPSMRRLLATGARVRHVARMHQGGTVSVSLFTPCVAGFPDEPFAFRVIVKNCSREAFRRIHLELWRERTATLPRGRTAASVRCLGRREFGVDVRPFSCARAVFAVSIPELVRGAGLPARDALHAHVPSAAFTDECPDEDTLGTLRRCNRWTTIPAWAHKRSERSKRTRCRLMTQMLSQEFHFALRFMAEHDTTNAFLLQTRALLLQLPVVFTPEDPPPNDILIPATPRTLRREASRDTPLFAASPKGLPPSPMTPSDPSALCSSHAWALSPPPYTSRTSACHE